MWQKPRPDLKSWATGLTLVLLVTGTQAANEAFSGVATAYSGAYEMDRTGFNACQFEASKLPDRWQVYYAALNTKQYGQGEMCGQCIKVEGAAGSAIAYVVDQCPTCGFPDIDLSIPALKGATSFSWDIKPVTWTFFPCPDNDPTTLYAGYDSEDDTPADTTSTNPTTNIASPAPFNTVAPPAPVNTTVPAPVNPVAAPPPQTSASSNVVLDSSFNTEGNKQQLDDADSRREGNKKPMESNDSENDSEDTKQDVVDPPAVDSPPQVVIQPVVEIDENPTETTTTTTTDDKPAEVQQPQQQQQDVKADNCGSIDAKRKKAIEEAAVDGKDIRTDAEMKIDDCIEQAARREAALATSSNNTGGDAVVDKEDTPTVGVNSVVPASPSPSTAQPTFTQSPPPAQTMSPIQAPSPTQAPVSSPAKAPDPAAINVWDLPPCPAPPSPPPPPPEPAERVPQQILAAPWPPPPPHDGGIIRIVNHLVNEINETTPPPPSPPSPPTPPPPAPPLKCNPYATSKVNATSAANVPAPAPAPADFIHQEEVMDVEHSLGVRPSGGLADSIANAAADEKDDEVDVPAPAPALSNKQTVVSEKIVEGH